MLKKVKAWSEKKITKITLLIVVLVFTFLLRSFHADRVPGYGHLEEQMFAWAGLYLIEEGAPVAWSTLEYPDEALIYSGTISDKYTHAKHENVDMYKPWLDQPPLFSLIIGKSAQIFGADRHYLIPSSYMRFPLLFIALGTSIMIFLIGRKLFGFWTGLGATFIWGTVPLFVFASRMAVPENAIALLYLGALYLFLKFNEQPRWYYFIPLLVIPGVAGLMKPTGFFIAPLIAFFFFMQRRWTRGTITLLATLPFIGAFLAYGYYYGGDSFNTILSIQGARPAGFNALTYLLSNPAFDISPFYDSWYVFSWILAIFSILIAAKMPLNFKGDLIPQGTIFIAWALIYWTLVSTFSGGEQDLLPWYRYPLFPLLAILMTLGLKYLYQIPGFLALALGAAFLLGNRIFLVNAFHPNTPANIFRFEFILLILPGLLYAIWQTKKLKQLVFISLTLMIIIGSVINILVVKDYYALICEAQTCPIGPSTFLTR